MDYRYAFDLLLSTSLVSSGMYPLSEEFLSIGIADSLLLAGVAFLPIRFPCTFRIIPYYSMGNLELRDSSGLKLITLSFSSLMASPFEYYNENNGNNAEEIDRIFKEVLKF
jgi:hypothetical protein